MINDATEFSILDDDGVEVTGVNPYLVIPGKSKGTEEIYSNIVEISHDGLEPDKIYDINLYTGAVKNKHGDENSYFDWKVSTYSTPFVLVTDTDPEDDESNVPINKNITITLNQNITANNLSEVGLYEGYENEVTDAVVIVSGNTMTISHSGLEPSSSYLVSFSSDVVVNAEGIGNESHYFSFTTAASTPLNVVQTTPEDGEQNVPLDTEVSVEFDQNISAIDLSEIYFADQAENEVTGISASVSGNTLTISHPELDPNTGYFVSIPNNVVSNSGGSANASIYWEFTTIAGSAPELVSVKPEDGQSLIPVDAEVRAEFTENIFASALESITITDAAGTEVTGIEAAITDNILLIAHDDFEYGKEYTVDIPAETIESSLGLFNE